MVKGQLSRKADRRQAEIEDQLALLGACIVLIEHDALRVRQAIRRCGEADLLTPVLEDHKTMLANLKKVQRLLRQIWDDGQKARWSG